MSSWDTLSVSGARFRVQSALSFQTPLTDRLLLCSGSRHGSQNRLPVYEIQDESAWKTDDVDLDDDDEGNVEMLGLVEGRPQVVKDEGSLSRV